MASHDSFLYFLFNQLYYFAFFQIHLHFLILKFQITKTANNFIKVKNQGNKRVCGTLCTCCCQFRQVFTHLLRLAAVCLVFEPYRSLLSCDEIVRFVHKSKKKISFCFKINLRIVIFQYIQYIEREKRGKTKKKLQRNLIPVPSIIYRHICSSSFVPKTQIEMQ